jgi:shikimate kinase
VGLLAPAGQWQLLASRRQRILDGAGPGVDGLGPTDHKALLAAGHVSGTEVRIIVSRIAPVRSGGVVEGLSGPLSRAARTPSIGSPIVAAVPPQPPLRRRTRDHTLADLEDAGHRTGRPDASSERMRSMVGRAPGGAVAISRVDGMTSATRPVLVLVGAPGAGKTTVGRLLARRLGVGFTDIDAVIVERAGKPIADIFLDEGEEAFRALERVVVAEALSAVDGVLALGGGSVLAAETRQLLRDHRVVHLTVGLADGLRRTGMSTARPLLAGVNPRATFRALLEARTPLYREVATVEVATDKRSTNQVARAVLEALGETPVTSEPGEDAADDAADGRGPRTRTPDSATHSATHPAGSHSVAGQGTASAGAVDLPAPTLLPDPASRS